MGAIARSRRDLIIGNSPYFAYTWDIIEMVGDELEYSEEWVRAGVAFRSPPDKDGNVTYWSVLFEVSRTLVAAENRVAEDHPFADTTVVRLYQS
ncbi:hypothetical protein ACFP2T_43375 [Plantactinospora solaniradicis]|uniref:Uncharacterized protein n=1 Tax=Plantactinospora solaniradicis TaxID=1723736 RepID=A0ABW1KMY7_9ACTN